MIENLKYIIFDMSEIDKIDFTQVREDSINTLLVSVDETKSFVHWVGDEPLFVSNIVSKQYHTNDEMITIINTIEWNKLMLSGTTI